MYVLVSHDLPKTLSTMSLLGISYPVRRSFNPSFVYFTFHSTFPMGVFSFLHISFSVSYLFSPPPTWCTGNLVFQIYFFIQAHMVVQWLEKNAQFQSEETICQQMQWFSDATVGHPITPSSCLYLWIRTR
jgi:hypothetical protein